MKTSRQIMRMDERALRRLVARLQVEIAEHELRWAGGGHPDDRPLHEQELADARRVKREVYISTPAAAPKPVSARESLPQIVGGIDYGAHRLVLARTSDRSIILWWRFCFTGWQGVGQTGRFPGKLVLACNPNLQTGFDTRTLHTGGRLSAKLLAKHHDEIAAAFCVESLDLHPRRTLVVKGP